jgi:SAM-dependent methyltransferase
MSAPFVDRFSDIADAYRHGRPGYPPHLFAALAALAPGRELAWDCGTGSGQAAVGLARHFDHVHATDPSERQIAQAVAHERVIYRVERAEAASLPDASADLALAAQAMHWFDLDAFYAEVARVLKPGGVLAALGYDWMYVSPEIDRAINERLLPPLAGHWAPQNQLLWDGYRSIPFPGEEIRLGAFAVHLEWSFEEVRGYISSWSALRDFAAAGGKETIDEALAEIGRLWGEGRRPVVMPLHLRVARLGPSPRPGD